MPSLSPAARSVSVRGDLKGPPKNERRYRDRHLSQGVNNKELTQLGQETRIWTRGNLNLSFSSDPRRFSDGTTRSRNFTQCRFFRHAGQLQCRVRAARAKTVLWGG